MTRASGIDLKVRSLIVFINVMIFLALLSGSHAGLSFVYVFLAQLFISITICLYYRKNISIYLMNGIYSLLTAVTISIVIISYALSVIKKGESSVTSEMRMVFIMVNFIFAFSFYYLMCEIRSVELLFISLPVGITYIAIYYFVDYNFNLNTLIVENVSNLPFAFNRRLLDMYCIFSIIYASYLYLFRRKKCSFVFGGLYVINVAFIFWVGGRGSILSTSIALIFLITAMNRKKLLDAIEIVKFAVLTILGLALAFPISIFTWNGLYRFKQLFSSLGEKSLDKISNGRLDIWLDAIRNIKEAFWFGHGPDSYREIGSFGFFQPHNFILQYFIEFGVIGTSLIIILISLSLIKGVVFSLKVSNNKNLPTVLLFVSIVLGYLIQGLVDGVFYWSVTTMLVTIGLVGIVATVDKGNKEGNNLF
ncbi:O-antigen ligase family protein [Vibrio comitans]|uniref:O-antigen ligase-related domain-containing protein n=1 Tax=Vibrio comitans NBRC 102076 TaxID=1219078 RepID=A0A4Y3ISH5_9VIBR|nr:O-antigen ligase family protein [Vibrio comitans]GEA61690.1 hypothetical protein VCO01S_28830 [Vibrio comitans NBRC 102076]